METNNDISVLERRESPEQNDLVFSNDQLLHLANQMEQRVNAINSIMLNSLRVTTHLDWVNIGGNPYLQETGASKIARAMGVSWQVDPPHKTYDPENNGHYSYQANGRFYFAGAEIYAYGLRSTHDDFFIGSAAKGVQKKPQDVNERDVMQAAYTNCLANGIKRILPGLRNITVEHLRTAGIDTSKMRGYGFNAGNHAAMSDESKNQKAEIERMLREVYGEQWTEGLKIATSFTGKDGNVVSGKSDINKISEKQMPITYKGVKTNYDKWVKDGRPDINKSASGGNRAENSELPMQ